MKQLLIRSLQIYVFSYLLWAITASKTDPQSKIRLRRGRRQTSITEALKFQNNEFSDVVEIPPDRQTQELCMYDASTGSWDCGGRGGVTDSLDLSKLVKDTYSPTPVSSESPSIISSSSPTYTVSTTPSLEPSLEPSIIPTSYPSTHPSSTVSSSPSTEPSMEPSVEPSLEPSLEPSEVPAVVQSDSAVLAKSNNNVVTLSKHLSNDCRFSSRSTDLSTCVSDLNPGTKRLKRLFAKGDFMCSTNKEFLFGLTLDGYLSICQRGVRVYQEGPFQGDQPYMIFQNGESFRYDVYQQVYLTPVSKANLLTNYLFLPLFINMEQVETSSFTIPLLLLKIPHLFGQLEQVTIQALLLL